MDIGFLVYPRLTPLDLVGPWEVFCRLPDARTHLIWTRPGPVEGARGLEISASVSFADAPALDILVVPGGPGQASLMKHAILLDYIRSTARTAMYTCSVCTGALLLAQAGILSGKRAATHWQAREALAAFGVDVVRERFVIDGTIASSAGVSAGIDLALELVRRLAGDTTAMAIQLSMEYDPQPPLNAGSPETAPPEIVALLRARQRRYQ